MKRYSGKALLLMKSLQSKLRAHGVSNLSLQDPQIIEHISSHVMAIENEELRSLLFQLQIEMGQKDLSQNDLSQKNATPSKSDEAAQNTEPSQTAAPSKQQQVIEALAEYCGPISNVLFEQALRKLGLESVDAEFDKVVTELSDEIVDTQERLEFIKRCKGLSH